MVVRTELCAFSEIRVYPGKGRRFVTRNGQMVVLAGSKADAMYHQRKKPAKLHWTQSWRRANKKLNTEATAKRKARKVVKTIAQRAVSGRDAEETNKLKKKPVAADKGAESKAGAVKHDLIIKAKADAKKAKLAAKEKKAKAPGAAKSAPAAKTHAGKGR